ncbi:MAG: MmcQ/YjbR family DNA-binding protein [Bacteroidetes bacterium]|nr:MmcQ/YjbR family DNA-binding protein [Bacteroidota bacterium]
MDIEMLREYCLSFDHVTEEFPFGNNTLVFKVFGKIFLLTGLDHSPIQFNAKSLPEKAIELREQYECIQPGYHMNKKHWNTITIDGDLPLLLIKQLIQDSYNLVYASIPKSKRK